MLKLLNSHTVLFRQYLKKYCLLHIVFISIVASSNKCSEFDLISPFIFLSKHKALYKQKIMLIAAEDYVNEEILLDAEKDKAKSDTIAKRNNQFKSEEVFSVQMALQFSCPGQVIKDCGDKIDSIFMQLAMQNNYPRQTDVEIEVVHKSKKSIKSLSLKNLSKYSCYA